MEISKKMAYYAQEKLPNLKVLTIYGKMPIKALNLGSYFAWIHVQDEDYEKIKDQAFKDAIKTNLSWEQTHSWSLESIIEYVSLPVFNR